ncbi:signal peptidase I [Pseudooceanicola sp. MF1-13]|uniref:signal peptidase I n=1 Tax=Pseudooceanicola sp. MF1-13 TaxID=3379095 RepID=UPI0038917F7A
MSEESQGFMGAIWETIKTIFWALLIAGVFRTLFFQPFWIPSSSMKDTLLIGDFLFVNKMAYGYSYASCPNIKIARFGVDIDAKDICGFLDRDNSRLFGGEPEQGDVVVFRHPVTHQDYIKRLIGMPGDTVQLKGGVLHLNGEPVQVQDGGTFSEMKEPQGPEQRFPRCSNDPVGEFGTCVKQRQIETLPNGVTYSTLNIRNGEDLDDTKVFTVPDGHYFFMGDNRDNSLDSRVTQTSFGVGMVPYENLIGRADRVMFSSAGRSMLFFWTWRGDRFFEAID